MPVQENFQEKDAHSTIQFFFYFYLLLLYHGHKPFSGMKLLIRFSHSTAKRTINQVSKAMDSMPDFASSYYVTLD